MLNTFPEPLSVPQETTPSDVRRPSALHRWERYCWLVALVLGLLQAWGRRHDSGDGLAYMGPDGISYLDVGDAYLRGDWHTALNAMWSPFYSWLLGITLHLTKPSPFWEFTVVRLLNFLIYAAALFSFAFFLRGLRSDHVLKRYVTAEQLPSWSWLVFGYSVFLWTSLFMNRVSRTSPDLLVAALIFLACGLLLQMRAGVNGQQLFVALGFVLGIGYLSKTVMFPLAFVFLGVAFVLTRRTVGSRGALLRVALALTIFLTFALPFIVALSRNKQRLTIGDSARLNYAWYVNNTTPFKHWQGGPPGSGTPSHPTRRILSVPAAYEFATPVSGTYPPWYDPSYWYEGVTPHFSLRQQLSAVVRNLALLYQFWLYRFFLVAATLLLFILFYYCRGKLLPRDIAAYWFLILPSLIAVSLYLLINIEPRYLAPFVAVLALSLFATLRLPQTEESRRLLSSVSCALVLVFIISIFPLIARSTYSTFRDLLPGHAAARDVQWQVAEGLREMNVKPGDRVAAIGNTMFAAWPRLARVRVVAEIPETNAGNVEAFWFASEEVRSQALAALGSSGARLVVADKVPRWANTNGWQQLGRTSHYVRSLVP